MRKLLIPVVTTVFVITAMLNQMRTVEPVLCDAPDVKLMEIDGCTSESVEVSEAEHQMLPSDTKFDKRRYEAQDGSWYQVSVVIGGRHKSSIHRPELCLPAQGFQMTSPHTVDVDGIGWRLITLARREVSSLGFAYTFFNQDGYRTCSHLARNVRYLWNRCIRGRQDRWVMVTVFSSVSDDARLTAFLEKLKDGIVKGKAGE